MAQQLIEPEQKTLDIILSQWENYSHDGALRALCLMRDYIFKRNHNPAPYEQILISIADPEELGAPTSTEVKLKNYDIIQELIAHKITNRINMPKPHEALSRAIQITLGSEFDNDNLVWVFNECENDVLSAALDTAEQWIDMKLHCKGLYSALRDFIDDYAARPNATDIYNDPIYIRAKKLLEKTHNLQHRSVQQMRAIFRENVTPKNSYTPNNRARQLEDYLNSLAKNAAHQGLIKFNSHERVFSVKSDNQIHLNTGDGVSVPLSADQINEIIKNYRDYNSAPFEPFSKLAEVKAAGAA